MTMNGQEDTTCENCGRDVKECNTTEEGCLFCNGE